MGSLLTIGEFSRATHLSVKALRHYERVGLLPPAEVDQFTGYRSYSAAQLPVALLIRRLRDLDMPLDDVKRVLAAGDTAEREEAIVAHLERMEQRLAETGRVVAALRDLLDGSPLHQPIEYRSIEPMLSVVVRAELAWDDIGEWLPNAFVTLHRALEAEGHRPSGPDGALYGPELFERHVGEVVAFVPVAEGGTGASSAAGVERYDVLGARFAIATHLGPFAEIDRAYGALGAFVAERMVGAPGPIREHYLSGGFDDPVLSAEVCWPVVLDA